MKTGVAYHDVRNPVHAREDLEDMVAHHCSFVVHTFSEADMIFYRRAMKEIVKASHDLGLEVYVDPWAVGRVFGGGGWTYTRSANAEKVWENLGKVFGRLRSLPA